MRVDRLLSIILIISHKGIVTGKELAEHFEVSIRTIYRDIEKISQAGIPIAATGGKGGGFYIIDNYNLDNLYLKKNEFQTFMAVMDHLHILFGKNQQFNDIVLKFENAYNKNNSEPEKKLSINMSHFSMEEELKECLFLMDQAIEENRLLVFNYINRNMEYSKRIAEPIEIAYIRGDWYLTSFCRNRNAYRKFKLVRIRNLSLGDHFIKRNISKLELGKIFDQGYDQRSIQVKLKFTQKIGEQLTEYFSKETIQRTDDGHFLIEEWYPNEEGLIKFILGFGRECEVLKPDYLREEIVKYLKEILQIYNG